MTDILLPHPFFTSLNAVAFVLGSRIERKLMQLFAGKTVAKPTAVLAPFFTAAFHCALRSPERFFYLQAAFTLHNLPPFAFAA